VLSRQIGEVELRKECGPLDRLREAHRATILSTILRVNAASRRWFACASASE